MTYARIIGTGSYLPEQVLTNADLEKRMDTSDEWIVSRTGIKSRRIAASQETTSSMAYEAAKNALAMAELSPEQLDLIIVATCTPERIFPSSACLVQQQLKITANIPAFDVSAACAGFIYALSIADSLIRTGAVRNALVVGSEVMSRIVDWSDRSSCILFGDGAGAVVLQASEQPGILSTSLHAQGQHKDLLFLPNDIAAPHLASDNPYVRMKGREVFKVAVTALGDIVEETLAANQLDKSAVDWLVPHQANLRIIEATAKKLNLPLERVILTVAEHGNTSAASIPLALDVGVRDGRIQSNHLILMEAFGGGLAWGGALVRF